MTQIRPGQTPRIPKIVHEAPIYFYTLVSMILGIVIATKMLRRGTLLGKGFIILQAPTWSFCQFRVSLVFRESGHACVYMNINIAAFYLKG